MSQDLILKGSFPVKPGAEAAFDALLETVQPEDESDFELDGDVVTIRMDENVGAFHATHVEQAIDQFVAAWSEAGAVAIQTGVSAFVR